jgi:hypothetical protein
LGEFIVGLQIVQADFNILSLRMASEVERQRCAAMRLAQQELERCGARRVAFNSLANSAAHGAGAVAIEQLKQMRDLMRGRFAAAKARSSNSALSGTTNSRRLLRVDSRALRLVRYRACWCAGSRTICWRLVGGFVLIALYVQYVRVISIPSASLSVPVSVGYERTEFALKTYPKWGDWDMLHDRGPWEDKIQQLWTQRSIWIVRGALWASYTFTLSCFLSIVCLGVYQNALEKFKSAEEPDL